jgi:hypothetical protein
MNLSQMNPQSRENARQRCLQMGVPADEMGGCIFDQGYLNIAPNVPPTPNVPTPGSTVLNKVPRPALNNNNHSFSEGKYPNRPETISGKPSGTPGKPSVESKETKPFQPKEPTVIRAPREPEVSPAPRPSAPSPAPKPSAPAPTPSRTNTPPPPPPPAPRPSAPAPTPSRTNTPLPPPKPSAPVAPKPSAPAVKSGKG